MIILQAFFCEFPLNRTIWKKVGVHALVPSFKSHESKRSGITFLALQQCFPTWLGLRHARAEKYNFWHPVASS